MFLLHFSTCKKSYIFSPFLLMENGYPTIWAVWELKKWCNSLSQKLTCSILKKQHRRFIYFFFLSFCFSLQLHDFKTGTVFLWDLIWTQCDYLDTRIHIFIVERGFSAKTSNGWTKALISEAKCKEIPKISNRDKPCFNAMFEKKQKLSPSIHNEQDVNILNKNKISITDFSFCLNL